MAKLKQMAVIALYFTVGLLALAVAPLLLALVFWLVLSFMATVLIVAVVQLILGRKPSVSIKYNKDTGEYRD